MTAAPRTRRGDLLAAAGIVAVLALTVLPLPPALLDLLLSLSLCAAVLTFLVAIYVDAPLDFSSFPSLLLFVTLFRLALNVASTRMILLRGGDGDGAAGHVIQAFGEFAVGGNFVVGGVVFLILVIVNFIVITKGAERISEVAARFTLDALPGKQMAIDADLGAGLIDEKQARHRRRELERQADFYGAMDGASKFVRGDAVAGLLIVAINIVGGMIIGVAQRDLGAGEAAATYTVLSIGDGLLSQIPALLVSTGAALLTTRSSVAEPLGRTIGAQLLGRRQPLTIAAMVLGVIGIVPGMPTLPFLALAGLAALGAARAGRIASGGRGGRGGRGGSTGDADESAADSAAPRRGRAGADAGPDAGEELEALLPVDLLGIDVGLDLLSMVDSERGGELLTRIASVRKQMAADLGIIVPPIHVRDDLTMRPGAYRILLSGVEVGGDEVRARKQLAIDPSENSLASLPGEAVREPTFGLPAKWIEPALRSRAESAGATVVDPSAVIATHITEVLRRHAADLLGRQEAQQLIDLAAKRDEKVVEELIPGLLSLGDVIKVLRNLLREHVAIRDLRTILEALADEASSTKDPDELTERVRQRLARRITRANLCETGELRALILDPKAEDLFREGGARNPGDARALTNLTRSLEAATRSAVELDEAPLLVVAPDVRRAVAAVAERHVPGLAVISYREIDPAIPFVTRGVIAAQEALP